MPNVMLTAEIATVAINVQKTGCVFKPVTLNKLSVEISAAPVTNCATNSSAVTPLRTVKAKHAATMAVGEHAVNVAPTKAAALANALTLASALKAWPSVRKIRLNKRCRSRVQSMAKLSP